MDLELRGRRALVTGGSRGIGKAVAIALAGEGAQIAIAARTRTDLEQSAIDIGRSVGSQPFVVDVDTGDDESVRRMVERVGREFGGVDILVNCAATPGNRGPQATHIPSDAFWTDFNVKVLGYLRCAEAVLPGMVSAGWGRIISVSGLAARTTGSTLGSIRNVSVAAMTKNLADQYGPRGVNVTVVHPGLTHTEATSALVAAAAVAQNVAPEEIRRRLADSNSIHRLIDASEVASVIAFLASPLSVAINGDAIACGGGTTGAIHY
jgi:NAD(P)-dependent dehydrogenase (short-subunit alcohol dehydrogenase family)